MNKKNHYISLTAIAVFFISLVTEAYAPLVLILFFVILFVTIKKLGNAIVLRDIIALYTVFITLLMPLVGYFFYPVTNKLSRAFVKYMPIPIETYFSYCLPATALFVAAMCWPIRSDKYSDEGPSIETRVKGLSSIIDQLGDGPLYMIVLGIISFYLIPFAPKSLLFVLTLVYLTSFVGVIYVYFRPDFPRRRLVLIGFVVFVVMQALQQGMFTIVAYMGMTVFSFIFIGKKVKMVTKLLVLASCIFGLIIMQSVKNVYRDYIWRGKGGQVENKALLYSQLVSERVANSAALFSLDAMFPIYMRTNQGYNIALVMRRFPVVTPYDDGQNIFLSIASSLVPRVFWPDKPMAGGKYNMYYYTGIKISGWSTNVGPLAEAYASFGPIGGALYMFLLGLFIRWFYQLLFKRSTKVPLLFLWVPLLFYQVSYSAENDTLQIFNSLLKAGMFVLLIYAAYPGLFGKIKKQVTLRRSPARPMAAQNQTV